MVYQFVSHIHIEEVLRGRFWQEFLLKMAPGGWSFVVHHPSFGGGSNGMIF
jgi:hypothetical protein